MTDADVTREWARQQAELRERLCETDDPGFALSELRRVGGVDISYPRDHPDEAVVALTILSFPALKPLHQLTFAVHITEPYVAGFLAFREIAAYTQAFSRLQAAHPELMPQALLVDGNGTLHPRGFGSACHLGVVLDLPTIGVAKNFLHIDDLAGNDARALKARFREGAQEVELRGESGRVYGVAVRPPGAAVNPVFVSVGHRFALRTAVEVVRRCSVFRVPEPIRVADLLSREQARLIEQAAENHQGGLYNRGNSPPG
ncbi:hypothetical protein H4S01_003113 [Coemansia sp. RSA 2610]|nr:hypothetical protein H4S01_003113 [Coemansia sp. RSA 2610]